MTDSPIGAMQSQSTEAGEILSPTIGEWQNNPSDLVLGRVKGNEPQDPYLAVGVLLIHELAEGQGLALGGG